MTLQQISEVERPKFESTIKREMDRQNVHHDLLERNEDGQYVLITMRIRWEGWLGRAVFAFNETLGPMQ